MRIHHVYAIPAQNIISHFKAMLHHYIAQPETHDILEIGAGANPRLDVHELQNYHCSYTILDSSQRELDKAPSELTKICADITAPHVYTPQQYDLIFSHTVAEHVDDAHRFHKNIFNLLKPGGYAIHFFPNLFTLPSLVNKFLPEWLRSTLLRSVVPRDEQQEKYVAHYHWCTGPTPTQIMRLLNHSYHIEEYRVFYGHDFYYTRFPLLRRLHIRKATWCAENGVSFFGSYAAVVLRKPHEGAFPYNGMLLE